MAEVSGAAAVLAQLGGVKGVVYSTLPVLVFVPVSSFFGLIPAVVAAVATATAILVWRLVRRETVQPAVSGFIGVGICAGIAWAMGETRGYFLLGIWSSLLWAVVFGVSVLIRRPIVGYLVAMVGGRDGSWRRVRGAVRAYDVATCVWVVVFASRFVVQRYLYDADEAGLLGVVRLSMGWPLTAVAALVTYLAYKQAMRVLPPDADAGPAPDAPAAPPAPGIAPVNRTGQ